MQNKVVCVGELLWDVLPGGNKIMGGSSTNVSAHLAKQGVDSLLISAVGDDLDGVELINNLTVRGLPSRLIQIKKDLPTSRVIVKLDEHQTATYNIEENVAWDSLTLTEEAIESVKTADAFVFCSLTCRTEHSRETISVLAEHAKLAVFDMNLRTPFYTVETIKALLGKADILKINEDELDYVKEHLLERVITTEEILKAIANKFELKLICLTLGADGAMIYYENQFYNQSGFKVEVADTVGAGDAFLACFVAGFLAKKPLPQLLEQACLLGSFVASQPGANPHYNENILDEFKRSFS